MVTLVYRVWGPTNTASYMYMVHWDPRYMTSSWSSSAVNVVEGPVCTFNGWKSIAFSCLWPPTMELWYRLHCMARDTAVAPNKERSFYCWITWASGLFGGGIRHTSMALYFYGAYKSLHKPRTTSRNILVHISYAFNYYLQLLCLQFPSKTHQNFEKFTFGIKKALFLKSLLYQSVIAKNVHLQYKTFPY